MRNHNLTKKQQAIYDFLCEQRGQFVNADVICLKFDLFKNTLRVHISNIREKGYAVINDPNQGYKAK